MTVEEKIDQLAAQFTAQLADIRALLTAKPVPAPVERADDLVSVDWIAALFDCKHSSVLKGKAGTKGILFVRRRPKMARRGQVMQVYRAYVRSKEPPAEQALRLVRRPHGRRRKTA